MNNKLLIGCIVLFLLAFTLIAGCGSDDNIDVVVPGDSGSDGSIDDSAAAPPLAEVSTELTSEEKEKANSRLGGTDWVIIGTPTKNMAVGESYVFGLGIKNKFPKTTKFKTDIIFSKGMTSGGVATLIPGIDGTIDSWLSKTRLSILSIDNKGTEFVPIVVTIGPKIASTQDTIVGSYTFDVKVKYESSPGFFADYATEQLTLRIKE